MPPVPVVLPDLGAAEIAFGQWHVAAGDRVAVGERLAEVLIPAAVIDVAAPCPGVLLTQDVRPLDFLQPGQRLGDIAADADPPGGAG